MADEENEVPEESTDENLSNESTPPEELSTNKATTMIGGGDQVTPPDDSGDDATKEAGNNEENGEEEKQEGDSAPEEYEEFEFSEGFEAPPEMLTDFKGYAKECNLSQEQAQGMVKKGEELVAKTQEEMTNQWSEYQEKEVEAIRADPKLGGRNFDKSLARANVVLSKYGTPEFRQQLADTGMGNMAGLVRFCCSIDEATKEGSYVRGDAPDKKTSPEDTWYKN